MESDERDTETLLDPEKPQRTRNLKPPPEGACHQQTVSEVEAELRNVRQAEAGAGDGNGGRASRLVEPRVHLSTPSVRPSEA